MRLNVFGVHTVLELAPVLLAVEQLYGSAGMVSAGGLAHLAYPEGQGIRSNMSHTHVNDAPIVQGSGLADVATNAETQALRVSLNRPDIRIVLNVSEGLYRIVAKRSAGIGSVADLAGKRVGTMPWTSAAYYLYKELKNAGLSEADVEIKSFSPAGEVSKAFLRGEVDAIAIWEPGSQEAVEALGDDGIELRTPGLYREIFNLNTTVDRLADPDTRKDILELIQAIMVSCKRITEHMQDGWRVAEAVSGHPPSLIRSSWPHHRFVATMPPDLLDVMAEQDQWLCRETSRPPRSREELAKLIDRSLYEEALRFRR